MAAIAAASSDHSDASMHIPAGQFGGLWRVEVYSDARIRLVSPQSEQQSSYWQGNTVPSVVYKEIPAHKYVLKAGSTYFRGLLTTGEQIAGAAGLDEGERAAKRARFQEISQGSSLVLDFLARHETQSMRTEKIQLQVINLTCDSQEEANANEAVIDFLYNHQLPTAPTVSMLCKMITAADYLGADLCVKACAIGVSKLPFDQHSIQQVCNVVDKVRSCPSMVVKQLQDALSESWDAIRQTPGLSRNILKVLRNALFACLLDMYSDALTIINNNDILRSSCKLPSRSIELWASSDHLAVDSENTVVVLLHNWWHSQPHETRTEECKKKLSALVRRALLSSGYLQYALDKLDWFIPPFPEYKFACSVVNAAGATYAADDEPLNQLNTTKRLTTSRSPLQPQLRLSLEQIQQAVASSTDWYLQSPQGYCQGHAWSLCLQAYPDNNGGRQGFKLSVAIVRFPANMMPTGIPAAAQITIQDHPFKVSWEHRLFRDNSSWHSITTFKEQGAVAALKPYFTADNHLVVNATISNVQ